MTSCFEAKLAMMDQGHEPLNLESYTRDALRTEKVPEMIWGDVAFIPAALDILLAAGKLADALKKCLIYSKPTTMNDLEKCIYDVEASCQEAYGFTDEGNTKLRYNPRLLHAALGAIGEGSELLETMQDVIDTDEALDALNVVEEAGDQLWYAALLLDEVEKLTGKGPGDVAARNIAKLKARFPGAFSLEHSNNRDYAAETNALKGEDK